MSTPLWNKLWNMQPVQVVLDEELLAATDQAAKDCRLNRSALVREALRAYLEQLRIRQLERRDREGYARLPDAAGDLDAWDRVAAWAMDFALGCDQRRG